MWLEVISDIFIICFHFLHCSRQQRRRSSGRTKVLVLMSRKPLCPPSSIPMYPSLFLSESGDVSTQTEAAVCRITATWAAKTACIRNSSLPRALTGFPTAGDSLTDSTGGARIFFFTSWRSREESSASHLWMWPNWRKWHNFTVSKMFQSTRLFLWSRSASRHRHIVIKSAAGVVCFNPSVHHLYLSSELRSDKGLGCASISWAGKRDSFSICTAMTSSWNCLKRKKCWCK